MRYVLIALVLFIPSWSYAAVMLSEIAWMGTTIGANEEWIELYNHGSEAVNVDGWTLTDSGTLSITLSGTIPAQAFALLERTDDTTVPGVSAFLIYTGALTNAGTTLTLKDGNGTLVDKVVGGENWENIGGSNETKETPQRGQAGWVTGTPTPGAENVAHDSTSDENEKDDADLDENNETESEPDGAGLRISLVPSSTELNLSFTSPEIAYVNQQVDFSTAVSGAGPAIINSLTYTWNFGDTYTGTGKEVSHTFKYPGEYVVVLNAAFAKREQAVTKVVRVVPVVLTLSRDSGGDIVLENAANFDIDLSGYTLRGTGTFTFPPRSFLLKGGKLTIDKDRIETKVQSGVTLSGTTGAIVAMEYSGIRAAESASPKTVSRSIAQTSPAVRLASVSSEEPILPLKSSIQGEELGSVLGSSTSLAALTIPVYAAEGKENTGESSRTALLPYFGLVGVLLISILLLYRRRE